MFEVFSLGKRLPIVALVLSFFVVPLLAKGNPVNPKELYTYTDTIHDCDIHNGPNVRATITIVNEQYKLAISPITRTSKPQSDNVRLRVVDSGLEFSNDKGFSLTITDKKTINDLRLSTLTGYGDNKDLKMSCSDIGLSFLPVAKVVKNGKDLLQHHKCDNKDADDIRVIEVDGKLQIMHWAYKGFNLALIEHFKNVSRKFNRDTLQLDYIVNDEDTYLSMSLPRPYSKNNFLSSTVPSAKTKGFNCRDYRALAWRAPLELVSNY